MPEVVWYRSLYWRIAFGFVALLATLLVIQVAVFLWLTVIVGRSTLGPAQLASEVAAELGAEIAQNPDVDVNAFVHNRFGHLYQPFLVIMKDGRSASNRPDSLPPGFASFARVAAARGGGASERGGSSGERGGRPRGGRRMAEIAPITAPGSEGGAVRLVS